MTASNHKTILITGTSRGIGAGLVAACENKNWNVIACQRHPSPDSKPQAHSENDKNRMQYFMDVKDPSSIRTAIDQIRQQVSHIDVLVNNAGVFPEPTDMPFEDLDPGMFREAFEVNLLGSVMVTQACIPLLVQGEHPRIINLSSGAASITQRSGRRYAYGASKAALNHVTRGLSQELHARGVTVVALSPGWVRTDMGGPDAELEMAPVAEEILRTIEQLKLEHSGKFLDRFGREGTYAW